MNSIDRNAAVMYAVALLTVFPAIVGQQQDLTPILARVPGLSIDGPDASLSTRLQDRGTSSESYGVPQSVHPDENATCDFIVTVPVGPELCLWIRW